MTRLQTELARFSWIYLGFAFVNLRVKLALTPAWFDGRLAENHQRLLAFDYVNHEQSRLLQFWIPELFHGVLGISIPDAYVLQRWLFLFLAFVCFHLYLRAWFDARSCFLGVTLLAAIMPLSYFNHLQESSPLLLLSFLLALWAIRDGRDGAYAAILAIGAANNETMLILPAVYFLTRAERLESSQVARAWVSTLVTALPAFAIWGAIRFYTRDHPYLGGGELGSAFATNLQGIAEGLSASPLAYWRTPYLFVFFVYGALWVFAFMRFSQKPPFLRRASWIAPLFVVIHLAVGVIYEVRQMLPLAFLLIPMSLFTLFPESSERSRGEAVSATATPRE